jgi:carbonic anhydrase/acetyltransferase-like protein (isoleucine patch superfamily)
LLIEHDGASPRVDPTAWIAPNAVLCGDVSVGPGCRIMFGAQVIAEGGSITIGRECIVMENAVLRSSSRHSLRIGDNCLVGPNAHVVGCTIEDEVFIATGAAIFHSAHLGRGSEVRINGVVHIKTRLPE